MTTAIGVNSFLKCYAAIGKADLIVTIASRQTGQLLLSTIYGSNYIPLLSLYNNGNLLLSLCQKRW